MYSELISRRDGHTLNFSKSALTVPSIILEPSVLVSFSEILEYLNSPFNRFLKK